MTEHETNDRNVIVQRLQETQDFVSGLGVRSIVTFAFGDVASPTLTTSPSCYAATRPRGRRSRPLIDPSPCGRNLSRSSGWRRLRRRSNRCTKGPMRHHSREAHFSHGGPKRRISRVHLGEAIALSRAANPAPIEDVLGFDPGRGVGLGDYRRSVDLLVWSTTAAFSDLRRRSLRH